MKFVSDHRIKQILDILWFQKFKKNSFLPFVVILRYYKKDDI